MSTLENHNTRFNLSHFKMLANTHEPMCISIYNPTFRSGKEVLEEHAIISFKNIVKRIELKLQSLEFKQNEIDNLLRPLFRLIEDKSFWTKQSDGLAIFLTPEKMELYKVPTEFKPYYYISDHFYLTPLIPVLNNNQKAYLLAFSLKRVNFYEITQNIINEIKLKNLPHTLEEIVGNDYSKTQLNASSGNKTNSVIHGQTNEKDIKDKEVRKFIREINKEVHNYLKEEKTPLILACDNQHAGEYKKINTYANLLSDYLPGSPENKTKNTLKEEAEPIFYKEKKALIDHKNKDFRNHLSSNRSLSEINEIIEAAIYGKVDTLFIQKDKDVFGLFDKENNTTIIDQNKKTQNASLFNLAAIHTILNGGEVFIMNDKSMPLPKTSINAFLRY